jgi:HSP20 family protein
MLMRSDPFREFDRFVHTFGGGRTAAGMPMDAYRRGEQFSVHFDLPGVDPSSIDLTVEKNVLTVSAQREWERGEDQEVLLSERPHGRFTRQLFLGDRLNLDGIQASYENGVLTVTVPVAERAKPRKVEITSGGKAEAIEAAPTAA